MFRVVVEILTDSESPPHLDIPPPLSGITTISSEPYFLDEFKVTQLSSMTSTSPNKGSEILFYSGNPTVESIKGVFHLCKDADSRLITLANGDSTNATDLWDSTIPVCITNINDNDSN